MASWRVPKLIEGGSRAPDFRLPLLDGPESGLAELIAGGPVLLAFFKISCPVCQLTLPYLERLHAAGATRVYGISQNDAEDTRDFAVHFKLHLPMLLDPEETGFPASSAYGISTVPTLFLIERGGTVGKVIEGWRKREIVALGGEVPDNVPEWKAG
jgi:peroxiredoxin